MVVGAARFVPADQQGRVPDVGARRGLHPLVGVVDPREERLTAQNRRWRVEAGDDHAVTHRPPGCRVVVVVPDDQARLDEREVGQIPVGGVGLDCENGTKWVARRSLSRGKWMMAVAENRCRLPDVDLPRLAVLARAG